MVATAYVPTVKLALELPIGTETVAGSFTALDALDSFTEIAPLFVPGTALRVTDPTEDVPPKRLVGFTPELAITNGATVHEAVVNMPPDVALTVNELEVVTLRWVTEKVTEEAPAGTLTDIGTVATVVLEDCSATVTWLPAIPDRLTVPVRKSREPPTTLDDDKVTD